MALIDFSYSNDHASEIVNGAIALRPPRLSDHEQWRAIREDSRTHLTRWEPDWRDSDVALPAFKDLLKNYFRAVKRGAAAPFFIIRRSDEQLIGGVNLVNIARGASQSAVIGYWVGAAYARKGYAFSAVEAVLGHAFDTLSLNRVEAACQPENLPSRALLKKIGFLHEGRARDYLKINGEWRDHMIYAMTAADWRLRMGA